MAADETNNAVLPAPMPSDRGRWRVAPDRLASLLLAGHVSDWYGRSGPRALRTSNSAGTCESTCGRGNATGPDDSLPAFEHNAHLRIRAIPAGVLGHRH
jgi:hypothetical protein